MTIKTITIEDNDDELSEDNKKLMKLSETYWKDYLKDKNYNKNINKMCDLCIENQIQKYGQQTIICSGINTAKNRTGNSEAYDAVVKTLSDVEIKELDSLYNPYTYMSLFSESNVPEVSRNFEYRFYQEQILSCVVEDTLVLMSDGSHKKIKDIAVGDKVVSYNENRRSTPINKVLNKWNNGIREIYKITLENGDNLECTSDHKILSHFKSGKLNPLLNCLSYERAYKSIDEGLEVGMDVYTLNKSPVWGTYNNTDIAKLLGYLVTDAYVNIQDTAKRKTVQFANIREEYTLEFKDICEKIFDCNVTYRMVEPCIHKVSGISRQRTYWAYINKREKLDTFLKSIGCTDKSNREMSIFNFVLNNFNEECTALFLNRAYAGDGCLYLNPNSNGMTISFHGAYKSELSMNWHRLLRKIGAWKTQEYSNVTENSKNTTIVMTHALSIKAFMEFTGSIFGKEEQSSKILSRLDDLSNLDRTLKRGAFNTTTRTKIISIEHIGQKVVYDIEVKNRHNFIANNIVVHNCSAKEKVVRMGRRCVPEYTKILMSDYSEKELKDINIGDLIITKKGLKQTVNPVVGISSNGIKPVYEIVLKDGKTVEVTDNHPLLKALNTDVGAGEIWCSIEEGLSVGDYVYTLDTDKHKNSEYNLQKIISIKFIKNVETFDLEVAKDHNFIANGIVTHNTGKSHSIAMLIVHRAIIAANINKPYRLLLVSPYAVQTEEVINNVKNICAGLPQNPITNSKQTPAHKIEFNGGGSILMGFTASTNADQIRGQPADIIILDETDDLSEKAIISIMGIRLQNPDVEIWRSGTPKGERNLHRAEQDPTTKSFHFPSYVIPHYTDAMDNGLRNEMGEGVGYVQEVLAEISSAENSVFQTVFISRAMNKYKFYNASDVMLDRQRYIVFIGVDWNHDKVGSRILVMAYDKITPQVYIIEKERVAIEGFTQHAAVEKIISLNRKYNCDHVFVDQGFGAAQIAELKTFAMSQAGRVPKGHPDLRLLDITPIDYGSSTEITDPITGAVYKTPTKQMAVLTSVEMLEKDLLALNPNEDNDIILQMKNYIEKSRNKGKIVYGYISKKIGDHDLDALMIGLFGMKKLYSTLFVSGTTQVLMKFADRLDEDSVSLNTKEDDSGVFGISFGKSSKNTKSNDRLNGLNRRSRLETFSANRPRGR